MRMSAEITDVVSLFKLKIIGSHGNWGDSTIKRHSASFGLQEVLFYKETVLTI